MGNRKRIAKTRKAVLDAVADGSQIPDPYLTPGAGVIMVRGDKTCAYCGKTAETRPYGARGEEICFTCATLPENEATTERQMNRVLFGQEIT